MSTTNIRRVKKRTRQADISCTESEKEINDGHLRRLADRKGARELVKLHSDGVLDGVVQLGAFYGNCSVKLFPLVIHSAYIRRRVKSICNEENNLSSRTNLVIELSDCPGGLDIFRIVENFCYGLLEEKDIHVAQVVKLIATSEFLEVDTLACRASKFLEERVLVSWMGCLSVLATFDNSDLKHADRLFQKCKTAFLRNIEIESTDLESGMLSVSCNLDCLLRVAQLLSPTVAESVYQSCRSERFGLCCSKFNQDVDEIRFFSDVKSNTGGCKLDQIPLCTHVKGSRNPTVRNGIIKVEYYAVGEAEEEGSRWLDGLETEKDLLSQLRRSSVMSQLRRSSLMVHLLKTMYLENDVKVPTRTIYLSRLRWGFLCSLLHRATDHQTYISAALRVVSNIQAPMGAEERAVAGMGITVAEMGKHPIAETGKITTAKRIAEVLEGKIETTKRIETELCQEMQNVEMLVGQALGEVSFWSSKSRQDRVLAQAQGKLEWSSKQDVQLLQFVTDCIEKLNGGTLQAVADQFKKFSSEPLSILSFGNVLDASLAANLRNGKYTVDEALLVYWNFPTDLRPSHDGIFLAFKSSFNDFDAEDEISLIELLDFAKLSDKTRSKLYKKVHHTIHPDLLEKFVENRVEKKRLCDVVNKLQNDLRVERADRMKVAEDKVLAECKLVKLTEDKLLVESKLAGVTHALKEEMEKMACGICFSRPRDVVCLPCMHFLYCFDCLHVHHQKSNMCPACRGFTSGVLKCHLSL